MIRTLGGGATRRYDFISIEVDMAIMIEVCATGVWREKEVCGFVIASPTLAPSWRVGVRALHFVHSIELQARMVAPRIGRADNKAARERDEGQRDEGHPCGFQMQ